LSNYPNLNSRLFNLFFLAVSSKVSNFATLETYFIIITLLAFFLRETILSLSLGFLILRFVLYLASYNSVAISIKSSTLPLSVRHIRLEVFLLIISFLKPVVNAS
jgi:hypothetical protein